MAEYNNTASIATLSAPIASAGATSCTVANFTGWPTPVVGVWAIIARGTASAEIVLITNVAGSTLTITRGQGGTTATTHGAGDTVEHIVPASVPTAVETHIAASTSVHGVTGSVVGTTGNQTIQDKTFRGAHLSLHSDTQPAGITSSFESRADDGSARDGFVHKNTAGDAARRAFLAEQSGTPRFEVFNTGKVKLNPSATPGFENDGTTQLDGATTINSTLGVTGASTLAGVSATTVAASGNATIGGTLGVTGTTTLGTTNAGAVSASSVAATGTVSANAVSSTTSVTGASATLSGAVSAGSVSASGAVSGATVAATGVASAHGGEPLVVSMATPSSMASPVADDVVWDRTNRDFYRREGSAWVPARQVAGRIVTTSGQIHTGIAGTEIDIAKLQALNYRLRQDNWYIFNVCLSAQFTAAGNSFTIRVREGTAVSGTVIVSWSWISAASGLTDTQIFSMPWKCTTSDGDADFFVSAQRASGAGTMDINGQRLTAFWIDDRGADTAVWSEVA